MDTLDSFVAGLCTFLCLVLLGTAFLMGERHRSPKPPREHPSFCYDGRDIIHSSLCSKMEGRRWAA